MDATPYIICGFLLIVVFVMGLAVGTSNANKRVERRPKFMNTRFLECVQLVLKEEQLKNLMYAISNEGFTVGELSQWWNVSDTEVLKIIDPLLVAWIVEWSQLELKYIPTKRGYRLIALLWSD